MHSSPTSPQTRTGDTRFSLDFLGTQTSVRETLASLVLFLEQAEVREDDRFMVEWLLAETLNNIVEHAYADRENGPIALSVDVATDDVTAHIVDQGRAMPGHKLPTPAPAMDMADQAREDLPEGGWGWRIIHNCASDLSYERTAGENRLRVRVPINAENPSETDR